MPWSRPPTTTLSRGTVGNDLGSVHTAMVRADRLDTHRPVQGPLPAGPGLAPRHSIGPRSQRRSSRSSHVSNDNPARSDRPWETSPTNTRTGPTLHTQAGTAGKFPSMNL